MSNFVNGKFHPFKPEKYRGDVTKIFYRSSWELAYMMRLDRDSEVVEWSNEEVVIPYRSVDGKVHRYFPDFRVKYSNGETVLIEIKPLNHVMQPKPQKRMTAAYKRRLENWMKNQLKWKYAREWAADHCMKFEILTEVELGIK